MKRFLLLLSGAAFLSYASAQEKTVTWPDASTHTVKPAFTLTVQVAESVERTFSFGTYNEFDFYAVDFGDGNLVLTDTVGYTTSTVTKTAVTGVATGDGVITVYAEDPSTVYYVTTGTGASTDSPVLGADFSKLTKVNTLSVGNVNAATLDLSALESLQGFTSFNGQLETLDFSNNPELKTVSVAQNKLKSVNISKNANLTSFTAYTNELETLDFSACNALEGIYAYGNKLTSVTLPENPENLGNINLQQNELTAIDLSKLTKKLALCYFNDNKLTSLIIPCEVATFEAENNQIAEFSVVDATKSCKLANNCMTLATLPTKPAGLNTTSKIKKFTYAPQADLAVEAEYNVGGVLDLSDQLTATGILEEPATTVYTLIGVAGDTIAAEAYTIDEGKITFTQAQEGQVYVAMTNEAFPLFTGDVVFKTTAFNVFTPVGIETLENAAATSHRYNLMGAAAGKGEKGFVIEGGRKMLLK